MEMMTKKLDAVKNHSSLLKEHSSMNTLLPIS